MQLNKLILTDFKNYEMETFSFAEKFNCFVGKNGAGKTNVLDAIYYLCMCKSYISGIDKNVVRQGQPGFRLEASFDVDEKEMQVVAKVRVRKKKVFECNREAYKRLALHIGRFPVVMIAPDDTSLAREGSEERRRFINNTLSQLDPIYLNQLIIYNRALNQRNAALKQFAEDGSFNLSLMEALNRQLLEPAAYIYQKRKEWMGQLEVLLKENYAFISNKQEAVSCRYESKLSQANFEDLLLQNLDKDRYLQRTTAGIHKDDLVFYIGDKPLKRFASQGQLKTFVLALKLAQYHLLQKNKDQFPLLLLDDIFDKLDASRVAQLLDLLSEERFGQVFLTDTHEERMKAMAEKIQHHFSIFKIENGQLKNEM